MRYLYKLLIPVLLLCSSIGTFAEELTKTEEAVVSMHPVKAEIIVENQTIQAGKPFWVALKITMDDHWHVYWKNPGDTGFPVDIEWILPEGMVAGSLEWPVPQRMTFDSALAFGYEKELILLTQITPTGDISPQTNISAKINWLVCSEETCMPGNSHVSTMLSASHKPARLDERVSADFGRARSQMPQKTANGVKAFTHKNNIELVLDRAYFDHGAIKKVTFFPEQTHLINSHLEPKMEDVDGFTILSFKREIPVKGEKLQDPKVLKGILVVSYRDATQSQASFEVEVPIGSHILASHPHYNYTEVAVADVNITSSNGAESIPEAAGAPVLAEPAATALDNQSFALALFFAFIGGMILNLMPCVLPVISIKILSFISMAGQSRSLTLKHGALFSLGVIVSFWIIAGLLIMLQIYGHSVGWGFHLQHPIFVVILATIFMLLSLNLFGIFEAGNKLSSWAGEVQGTSNKGGFLSSFMSGMLATAVATPCTGPFLGASIGLAATLSPIWSLMIFTFLGMGMAFPYILLAAFPVLLKAMPRPGNWMVTFKELMGFFMLATALWLLWVFAAQTSSHAVIVLLGGFLGLSLAAWIYGKWSSPMHKKMTKIVGITVAVGICLASGYIIVKAAEITETSANAADSAQSAPQGWEPFSPERIAELQQQGIPVIVDFTAKWCLICQTNHMVFSSSAVESRLNELGVVKMLADWTKSDPVITEELKKYGRNSVPLYLLYGTDPSQPPVILPQVLTVDNVLASLETITDMSHIATSTD